MHLFPSEIVVLLTGDRIVLRSAWRYDCPHAKSYPWDSSPMHVTSSLPDTSEALYAVPERHHGRGVLLELAESGVASTPVPVPVPEAALQSWSEDVKPRVFRLPDVARCMDALEVRFCTVACHRRPVRLRCAACSPAGAPAGLLGTNSGRNQTPKIKQHEARKAGDSHHAFCQL